MVGPAYQDLAADRGDHPATRSRASVAASTAEWRPALPPWQIATARASAAWSGLGGSGRPSRVPTIRCTCFLPAPPEPQTAILIACGVYAKQRTPRSAAASIAIPLAWPTAVAERTFLPK